MENVYACFSVDIYSFNTLHELFPLKEGQMEHAGLRELGLRAERRTDFYGIISTLLFMQLQTDFLFWISTWSGLLVDS